VESVLNDFQWPKWARMYIAQSVLFLDKLTTQVFWMLLNK